MIGDIIRMRYEIVEDLGSSTIFENYVAKDKVRGHDVCIRMVKSPFRDEPDFVQTLGRVIEKSKAIDHPNVARVYEIDEHEEIPFIVCEFVKGSTLAERIRRLAPFSPSVVCEMGIGICEAIESAQTMGIHHGDLCADHVVSTLEGRIAVLDFGLWECYGASKTAGAVVLGRMAPYLSPEIIEGGLPNSASDVYAIGVILFELLTGVLPFSGLTPAAILSKHSGQPVPSVRAMNPAVPQVFDEIIQKALAKNPIERYPTASALLGDLRQLLDALRFGKKLSWPLTEPVSGEMEVQAPQPVLTFAEKKAERKLGAVLQQEAAQKKQEMPKKDKAPKRQKLAEQPPDHVHKWLRYSVWVFATFCALAVISYIWFNMHQRKVVEVPNLIGKTYNQARDLVNKSNLEITIISEEYNDDYPQPKTIFFQETKPQTPVREGFPIRVKLSLGGRMIEVPDLRGLPITEAKARLENIGLKLDPTIKRESSRNIEEDLIIKSDPSYRERVERGTPISLTISSGRSEPEKPRVSAEDLFPNTWSLSFKVQSSDTPVMVRVEMTDARGVPQVIFEEEREGNEQISLDAIKGYGKEATFRIYFNNFLDATVKRKGVEG